MREERYKAKLMILILVYIPSLTLFWDVISLIFGDDKTYSVFQFMCATYFMFFSIFLTRDMEIFNNMWENNKMFRRIVDRILHISAVIIAWIPRGIMLMICAFSDVDAKSELEINKKGAREQINLYDNMPVAARVLLPVGLISIVMIVLVSSNVFSDMVLSWIQEVLNTLVSLVGLFFVAMNVKEKKRDND